MLCLVFLLHNVEGLQSAIPVKDMTAIALHLKYQVEQSDPLWMAGRIDDKDHSACVVRCLLVYKRWFKRLFNLELGCRFAQCTASGMRDDYQTPYDTEPGCTSY